MKLPAGTHNPRDNVAFLVTEGSFETKIIRYNVPFHEKEHELYACGPIAYLGCENIRRAEARIRGRPVGADTSPYRATLSFITSDQPAAICVSLIWCVVN